MLKTVLLAAAMAMPAITAAQAVTLTASAQEVEAVTLTIPSNTEVILRLSEDLSTKGGQINVGHVFNLTVAYDVRVGGVIVIPAGTPAKGEVTMRTGRAMFGKSGKMEIELRSVDLNGQRIPVTGKYRQEGEGDTLAAVGAVVLFAPLLVVTGKSAVIPRGRELSAYTMGATTVAIQ